MKGLIIAALAALSSAAHAETFRFDHEKGHLEQHDHRCASPLAKKRLTDFVAKDLRITVGHEQMTVVTKNPDTTSSADSVAGTVGRWMFPKDAVGAQLTVVVNVMPFGWCSTGSKATTCDPVPEVKISIIQRFDGAECYESWRGDGVKL